MGAPVGWLRVSGLPVEQGQQMFQGWLLGGGYRPLSQEVTRVAGGDLEVRVWA